MAPAWGAPIRTTGGRFGNREADVVEEVRRPQPVEAFAERAEDHARQHEHQHDGL